MVEHPKVEVEAEVEVTAVEWDKIRMQLITVSIFSQWEVTGPLMAMCK